MEKGVVFKYPLNIGGVTIVKVPTRSQFLSAKVQGDNAVVYFLENAKHVESEGVVTHHFYAVGTGHSFTLDRGMQYIDTLLLFHDKFVIHVFKIEEV